MSRPPVSRLRRLLLPALLTAAGFAILVSLGLWQLERKVWKQDLIATIERQRSAPAAPLPTSSEWGALTRANSEFRRAVLQVEFIPDAKPVYVYTGASALREDVKEPGYFVFAPARLPDGNLVVINRGYVPLARKDVSVPGTVEITGYIRWPDAASWFVSEHDATGDIWFARNTPAMAAERGWGRVAPFYIDQEGPIPAEGSPRPGPLTIRLRNDHLGYALTWFGLGGTLLLVFGFWAVREWYDETKREPRASL